MHNSVGTKNFVDYITWTLFFFSDENIDKYNLQRKKKLEKKEKEYSKRLAKFRKKKRRIFKWKANECRRILDRIHKEIELVNHLCISSKDPNNMHRNLQEKENVLQSEDSSHISNNTLNTTAVHKFTKEFRNTPSVLEQHCNNIKASLQKTSALKELNLDANLHPDHSWTPADEHVPNNTNNQTGNVWNSIPRGLDESFEDNRSRSCSTDVEIISNPEVFTKEVISIEIDSDCEHDMRNLTNQKWSSPIKHRDVSAQIGNSSTPLVNGMGNKFQVNATASSVLRRDSGQGIMTGADQSDGNPQIRNTPSKHPVLNSSGNFICNEELSVGGGDFMCRVCREGFSSEVLLKNHGKLHQVRNFLSQPYLCKQCSFRTTSQHNLTRHYKKWHRW